MNNATVGRETGERVWDRFDPIPFRSQVSKVLMSGPRPASFRHDYDERNVPQAPSCRHLFHALLSGTQFGGLLRRPVVRKIIELGLLLRGQIKRIGLPWLFGACQELATSARIECPTRCAAL